jgi:hypothetical protein
MTLYFQRRQVLLAKAMSVEVAEPRCGRDLALVVWLGHPMLQFWELHGFPVVVSVEGPLLEEAATEMA